MSDPPITTQDSVARLIRAAGRRESPPAETYERALSAATDVWQKKVSQRRRRMMLGVAAGIAALAVSFGAAIRLLESPHIAPAPVASVARVIGSARRASARLQVCNRHAFRGISSGADFREPSLLVVSHEYVKRSSLLPHRTFTSTATRVRRRPHVNNRTSRGFALVISAETR